MDQRLPLLKKRRGSKKPEKGCTKKTRPGQADKDGGPKGPSRGEEEFGTSGGPTGENKKTTKEKNASAGKGRVRKKVGGSRGKKKKDYRYRQKK